MAFAAGMVTWKLADFPGVSGSVVTDCVPRTAPDLSIASKFSVTAFGAKELLVDFVADFAVVLPFAADAPAEELPASILSRRSVTVPEIERSFSDGVNSEKMTSAGSLLPRLYQVRVESLYAAARVVFFLACAALARARYARAARL